MPKPTTTTVRRYGKQTRKTSAELLWEELPNSPAGRKRTGPEPEVADAVGKIAEQLRSVTLKEEVPGVGGASLEKAFSPSPEDRKKETARVTAELSSLILDDASSNKASPRKRTSSVSADPGLEPEPEPATTPAPGPELELDPEPEDLAANLRVLTWADVCPAGDGIEKIAEASYAEVYRVTNALGTSIIKAVRLRSPLGPPAPAQARAGFVDEVPHAPADLCGELRVAEWLADVPGFVIYKERYVVRGRAPRPLLETHRAFHRRLRKADPDRLQFYPSPSRYLDDTDFLVVELGDAGTALEDFELRTAAQVWDVFLHTAVALARAEDLIKFEHRDLHEGNLCIRQVSPPRASATTDHHHHFGASGLDITILDYGLSRAEDPHRPGRVVAFDLEKDLSLFASTHAPQCAVYRRMRSFLLTGDRVRPLGPEAHTEAYAPCLANDGKPLCWAGAEHHPYTNVLWLAYLYEYLVGHFCGDKRELARFRRATRELWTHLNPDAPRRVLSFPSAVDVVRYAVEAGWVAEEQLVGGGERSRLAGVDGDGSVVVAGNESIVGVLEAKAADEEGEPRLRRSPRKSARR